MNFLYLIQHGHAALVSLNLIASTGDLVEVRFSFLQKNTTLYFKKHLSSWRLSSQKINPKFGVCIGKTNVSNHLEVIPVKQRLFINDHVFIYSCTSLGSSFLNIDFAQQKEFLNLARKTGENFLRGEIKHTLEQGREMSCSACVSLWKDGKVRGSFMDSAATFEGAIIKAVHKSLTDLRWKPVTLSEWPLIQIEITIYSPISIPIEGSTHNHIDYTKGYITRVGSKLGLYLPEVFNTSRFRNQQDFFDSLLKDKGRLNEAELRQVIINSFDVIDFIESSTQDRNPLLLRATMPSPRVSDKIDLDQVRSMVSKSISWLQKLQEDDGNICPTASPFTKSFAQVDWDRLCFVILTLAEWGKRETSSKLESVMGGALAYAESYLGRRIQEDVPLQNMLYGSVYLAHVYSSLGKFEKANELASSLLVKIKGQPFEPIIFLQSISLMRRLKRDGEVEDLESKCKQEFYLQRDNPQTDVASWAEAVVSFESTDSEFVRDVIAWILSHQERDGSFRQSRSNSFHYTRGTGKIFEVLATNPAVYKTELTRSHDWLVSMQYDESNTYFIDPRFREFIYGGMRHDYNNPDAWIDSVGHYILGASRLYEFYRS